MNEDKERERRKRENKRRTNELRQTIRTHYYIMLKIVTVLGHERLLLHFLYTIPQFLYTGDLQSFYN